MSPPDQSGDRLKVALCTREYPPEVYGGAGVHVEYLAKELSKHVDLTVHCQGADRPTAVAHRPWDHLKNANPALQTISTGLSMVAAMGDIDLVHSHTWYANMAAHLTSLLYGIPRVVIGENRTFEASEQWLRANGVDVVVLDLPECVELMAEFIAAEPQLWNEDIGVEDAS